MDCIFCKIAKGEIDSAKVFEDEDVFAFLDIQPLTKGHCLVIPKKHFENIFDIDESILQKISIIGKTIAKRIKENFHADGINFLQSNGQKAGQIVFHYHLHVIPRYEDDALKIRPIWETGNHDKVNSEELKNLAEEIKSRI